MTGQFYFRTLKILVSAFLFSFACLSSFWSQKCNFSNQQRCHATSWGSFCNIWLTIFLLNGVKKCFWEGSVASTKFKSLLHFQPSDTAASFKIFCCHLLVMHQTVQWVRLTSNLFKIILSVTFPAEESNKRHIWQKRKNEMTNSKICK